MPFGSLWLAVLVSTIAVFVVSCIVHVVLPFHKKDHAKLPDEEGLTAELRKRDLPGGSYMFPHPGDCKDMKDPAFKAKWEEGPVGLLLVRPKNAPGMGGALGLWACNVFLVSFVTAYVARHALDYGAACVPILQITSAVAIASYTMAQLTESIWKWRPWRTTFVTVLDGVAYGLVTALVFCWLWPAAA